MVERILHQPFGLRIQRRCGLIQQQDRGIAQDGAGNGNTLPLPAGQARPAFTHIGVEAIGQFAQKLCGIGAFSSSP